MGAANKIQFMGDNEPYEIINPVETITIKLEDDNILKRRAAIGEIKVDRLSNNKYVIQQISEVSCGIAAFAMILTDNGIPIHDTRLYPLFSEKLTGTGVHYGTNCKDLDEFLNLYKLQIPNKHLLHATFYSRDLEYDVRYFDELIRRYGSGMIHVGFTYDEDRQSADGHYAVLDSIDNNYTLIREPYHGYAFRIPTRLFLTRKIGKSNNKYSIDFFSTKPHTSALTDEEEDARMAEATANSESVQVKYLKYKAKYLQLKKKL
jgi:hypothetical protein